jgi:hypothetical protein
VNKSPNLVIYFQNSRLCEKVDTDRTSENRTSENRTSENRTKFAMRNRDDKPSGIQRISYYRHYKDRDVYFRANDVVKALNRV